MLWCMHQLPEGLKTNLKGEIVHVVKSGNEGDAEGGAIRKVGHERRKGSERKGA